MLPIFLKITNWAKVSYDTSYQFNLRTTSYKSQIMKIEKYNQLNSLLPQTTKVVLPYDNLNLDVFCYDFTSMICSVLATKKLSLYLVWWSIAMTHLLNMYLQMTI